MKIRDVFKFKPLALHGDALQAMQDADPIPLTHKVLDKSCLVGIEVEVENVPVYLDHLQPLWLRTEDNSLRDNGWEYISAPVKGEHIEYSLRRLFRDMKKHNPKYTFSGRTSIHVHMNARTMTCDQAAAMLLLYTVFEKTLFRFIGKDREHNHHCVPVRNSNISAMMSDIIFGRAPTGHWQKYTAVNILPLSGKGTLEFRHMHGTDDVDRLMVWINLLMKLKLYCYKRSYGAVVDEISKLNSTSLYLGFSNAVFEELSTHLDFRPEDLAEGVSLVKLYYHSNNYLKEVAAAWSRSKMEGSLRASDYIGTPVLKKTTVKIDVPQFAGINTVLPDWDTVVTEANT